MKPAIDFTMSLHETVAADGAFRRTLDEHNPPRLHLGQCLKLTVNLGDSVRSGAGLTRVMLAFQGDTPLRDDLDRPIFEATFENDGKSASWISPPLHRTGEFRYYLWVELEDEDGAAPVAGNHVALAWPQMVIDDKPPG
jgi:hypothetical protein